MRRLHYIWVMCAALLSVACNKENIIPEGDDSSITVPEGGPYIYLDAIVKNKTRGTLIEGNELQDNFGVYGFTYNFTNRWSTYRVTATPNVFKNNNEEFIARQEVVYGDGIYSYTPVQTWSGGKYTFFAYYPFEHNSIKEKSGIDDQGTPWVKYAPRDFLTSTDGHIDVMTAMFEDTSLSSSQYVNFDFKHRLSAIDVVALNFYEYNENVGGGNVTSERIEIEISELNIAFNNLDYKAATFYLDSSIPTEPTPVASNDPKPSYNILSSGSKPKLIGYSSTSEFQHIDKSQTLLVIPQTNEDLEVTTTVSFKKKRDNGTYLSEDGSETFTSSKTTKFGQALKAGSRYFIQITFTSAAVSINILTSAEWEDLAEDVYHEFE